MFSGPSPAAQDEDHFTAAAPRQTLPGLGLAIAGDLETPTLPFDEWTAVFGSERLTGALLDRLTHHVHILEMNGDSIICRLVTTSKTLISSAATAANFVNIPLSPPLTGQPGIETE